MPAWVVPAFVAAAALSLLGSSRLVRSLERLGGHFAMPELLLGLVVAAAADGPELTSAISALLQGQRAVGLGVLLGSNVFNIAALLGLGSLVAGRVNLQPRVVVLEGVTALGVGAPATAFITGGLGPLPTSVLALAFFAAYLVLALVPCQRLPLPYPARCWLEVAVRQEEVELAEGLHAEDPPSDLVPSAQGLSEWAPTGQAPTGRAGPDAVRAAISLALVVGASALMEHAATVGGSSLGLPQVVVGGVVLAAVTSLPNAVAAVYLARAGRGAALMAEAMNSNSINVVGGVALPALAGGLVVARAGNGSWVTAGTYMAMTLAALVLAGSGRGLGRRSGATLVAMYLGYLVALAVFA